MAAAEVFLAFEVDRVVFFVVANVFTFLLNGVFFFDKLQARLKIVDESLAQDRITSLTEGYAPCLEPVWPCAIA